MTEGGSLRRTRFLGRAATAGHVPAVPQLSFGGRRRRRWPGLVVLALAAVVVVASRGGEPTPGTTGGPTAAAAAAGHTPAAAVVPDDPATPLFARIDGAALHLPADEALVLGFHEAATTTALPLDPVGSLRSNRNTTRFTPPDDDPRGADYLVLSSRGRSAGPTSAADIVLGDGTPVRSPVTGTVRDVRPYLLYGRHADHRLELVPDDAPHLRVVLLHVDDVLVAAGERVTAGVTPLAGTANRFPFGSQIDRETGPDRWPHVHLEVHPLDAPRLGEEPADADPT